MPNRNPLERLNLGAIILSEDHVNNHGSINPVLREQLRMILSSKTYKILQMLSIAAYKFDMYILFLAPSIDQTTVQSEYKDIHASI